VVFKKMSCVLCTLFTLYSVLCDGHWRQKYKRDEDETLEIGQDKERDAVFRGLV